MKIRVEIIAIYNTKFPVKAIANIILDESFIIHNVRLIHKNGKKFVSMPSQKNKRDDWQNLCHPTKPESRNELEAAYFEAYNSYNSNPNEH